jgi:hypothetical protein
MPQMLSGAPITVDTWKPLLQQRAGKLKVHCTQILDAHRATMLQCHTLSLCFPSHTYLLGLSGQVLITHGRSDPVLPFVGSTWLKDLVSGALGAEAVTYQVHNGGHELGGKEADILRFLGSLV